MKLDYFLLQVRNENDRIREETKIREVMTYAESRDCRWVGILKYFGEQVTMENCGTCDVCISENDMVDATEITKKVLSAVLRTGERFGKAHVVKVLRGSSEKNVVERGHNELSVWGICKEHGAGELTEIFMQLVSHGMIVKNEGEYPTFSVTAKGRKFLKDKESILLPKIEEEEEEIEKYESHRKAKKPKRGSLDYDVDCFEVLREIRTELARKKGVPAFIIFGDVALQQMAFYKPVTLDEFAKISGVGEQKLKKYGKKFTKIIAEYKEN